MWGNKEVLNLSQKKKKKLFGVGTKWSYYNVFQRTSINNRNEKKKKKKHRKSNILLYECR